MLDQQGYDRLGQTDIMRKAAAMPREAKLGVEAGLYALTAVLDQKLAEDSFFQKLIKEVAVDAGPEISKRLLNGVRESLRQGREDTLRHLAELDDESLLEVLSWYRTSGTQSGGRAAAVDSVSLDELLDQSRLSDAEREKLRRIATSPPKREPDALDAINERLAGWLGKDRRERGGG